VTYRVLYIVSSGLILACIIHLAIVLMVPVFGQKDVARQISSDTPQTRFVTNNASGAVILPHSDPFFKTVSCRFDLERAGLVIDGEDTDVFWSAAIFNSSGRVVYSLNKRTSIANQLKMIVVNPVQMARLRQFQPELLETSIVVETQHEEGFAVVRVLQRDESHQGSVEQFVSSLNCTPFEESEQSAAG